MLIAYFVGSTFNFSVISRNHLIHQDSQFSWRYWNVKGHVMPWVTKL